METVEELWIDVEKNLAKMRKIFDKDNPGILTEQIVAINALTKAITKYIHAERTSD
jgi:hypothetical protein